MVLLAKRKHISFQKIELFLFYFTILDILFFPYVFWIATTYSQIFVAFWFFTRKANCFSKNEYKLFLILIYLILLSTAISFFTVPVEYYFSEGLIENIKRAIQLIFSMTYYFFFFYMFSHYKFDISKIAFCFVLYVGAWGVLYFYDFDLFIALKGIFNSKDSFLGMIDGMYIYRFSFIWADPNNIGYTMVGVTIYLLCNCKTGFLKGMSTVFVLVFVLFLTMSSGSWLSFLLFFPIPFFLWVFESLKKTSAFNRLIVFVLFVGATSFIIYNFIEFQKSELGTIAMERVENNSGDSRFVHWKNTLNDKIIPLYVFCGEGYQTFVKGIPYSPHSGHLLLYFGYGLIGYLIFMYITFRKRRGDSLYSYQYMLPFLICFTINIAIGELKFIGLLYLFIASTRRLNKINKNEDILHRTLCTSE